MSTGETDIIITMLNPPPTQPVLNLHWQCELFSLHPVDLLGLCTPPTHSLLEVFPMVGGQPALAHAAVFFGQHFGFHDPHIMAGGLGMLCAFC